jgi:hypothetical protein
MIDIGASSLIVNKSTSINTSCARIQTDAMLLVTHDLRNVFHTAKKHRPYWGKENWNTVFLFQPECICERGVKVYY